METLRAVMSMTSRTRALALLLPLGVGLSVTGVLGFKEVKPGPEVALTIKTLE